MKKNLSSLFLIFIGVQAIFAQAIWNGTADTDWYSPSQSEFTISTAEQLAGLSELVSGGNDFKGKVIKLGQNIILNDTANWQSWATHKPANEWASIGYGYEFRGTFDGNGKVVSGIYINSARECQGLFGVNNGTIKKLGVVASYIKGEKNVGGLAGQNNGSISNSYSAATVDGEKNVGGLVGNNYVATTISNNYSIGKVTGKENTGGLIGINYIPVCGPPPGPIIIPDPPALGKAISSCVAFNIISNSYYNKQTSGQSDDEGKGKGKTTMEMKTKITFNGWDFTDIWGIDRAVNSGYPYLLQKSEHLPILLPQIAKGQINVQIINNAIILENMPRNAKIEVYNLRGEQVYMGNSENSQILRNKDNRHLLKKQDMDYSSTLVIRLAKGMYILKINTVTFQVPVMY